MLTVERQGAWSWPPKPAAIAALVDLGLSRAMIAKYFSVPENRVDRLLDEYGLMSSLLANGSGGEVRDPENDNGGPEGPPS